MLVPAYLIVVPFEFALEAPLQRQVEVAMPLLEAVEHAVARAPAFRSTRGSSAAARRSHALERLWDVERFDRIIVPGAGRGGGAASPPKELAWMLANAPSETLVLRPAPTDQARQ